MQLQLNTGIVQRRNQTCHITARPRPGTDFRQAFFINRNYGQALFHHIRRGKHPALCAKPLLQCLQRITEYRQNQPVRFGKKRISLSVLKNGRNVEKVEINGKKRDVFSPAGIELKYEELPDEALVAIYCKND